MEKNNNLNVQGYTQAAKSFEKSTIDEIKRSRKQAWIVCFISILFALIALVSAAISLLTRVEPEPTIIQVDKSSGYTTVLRSVKNAEDQYDEVVNKHWLARYVVLRESYDWYTISTAYGIVNLMSSGDVSAEYERKIRAPNGPLEMLGKNGRIDIEVDSIAFIGATAQVRFSSEKLSADGINNSSAPKQRFIATIVFKYDASQRMTSQERLENPLGFKVLSYRIDSEVMQ